MYVELKEVGWMTPQELLHELETLTHTGRVRYMIEIGRRVAAGEPDAPDLLNTLRRMEQGDFFRRFMALQSCHGSRDGTHALRALSDPSRKIRGLAIGLLPLLGSPEQVLTGLVGTTDKIRRILFFRLRKAGRENIIEAFQAGQPPVETVGTWVELRRQAILEPETTIAATLQHIQALNGPDYRVLGEAITVMSALYRHFPDQVLELAKALMKHFSIASLIILQKVLELRPNEVADLVLSTSDRANLNFKPVLQRLDNERLLRLYHEHNNVIPQSYTGGWLRWLTVEQRWAIYATGGRGWQQPGGEISIELLRWLPADLRIPEARRSLALAALANVPALRLPYAGLLPWSEARDFLNPYLSDPDPDLRVLAHKALAEATRYYRSHLDELLHIIRARKNEQDPIRLAMIAGLADIPPTTWQGQQLIELGGVIREALNAADLSYATAARVEGLVIKLLPFQPAWAAEWLATLVGERGQISAYNLEARLTEADVRRIAPLLLPVLQSWANREREGQLVQFAQSLRRRLSVFDDLVTLLLSLMETTRTSYVASTIMTLIARFRRDLVPNLIPELIKKDPSWATLAPVYNYLHRWRQDLLTPFPGSTNLHGSL